MPKVGQIKQAKKGKRCRKGEKARAGKMPVREGERDRERDTHTQTEERKTFHTQLPTIRSPFKRSIISHILASTDPHAPQLKRSLLTRRGPHFAQCASQKHGSTYVATQQSALLTLPSMHFLLEYERYDRIAYGIAMPSALCDVV